MWDNFIKKKLSKKITKVVSEIYNIILSGFGKAIQGAVDTTPGELENGGFSLECNHIFSVHTMLE